MQNTYSRRGRIEETEEVVAVRGASVQVEATADEKGGMRVNGYQQVYELMVAADPAFRESLLRRLAQRDPALVRRLREQLIDSGVV